MTRHEDPEDALRALWARLEPPERSAEIEDQDAETRAAIDWLREGWKRLEVPVPPASSLTPAPPRQAAPHRPWRLGPFWPAAAAALALAAGAFLWRGQDEGSPRQEPVVDTPAVPVGPEPLVQALHTHAEAAPRNELVLRSGPVRLILCQASHSELEVPSLHK